jgi:3-oxoacyl-[acyl-carrier protein] reductase
MDLNGRVALITAGAGAGIGRASAKALALAGADVVVTDKHERRTAEAAKELAGETGRNVIGLPLDATDENRVRAVVDEAVQRMGRIDILLSNTGVNELQPIWEMSSDTWRRVIDVSLTAQFLITRAVLPHMIEQRSGSIILMSSAAGWTGKDIGEAHYAAAKAGVMALTRVAAAEVAKFGIRVNAIAPGLIYNEFLGRIYPPEYFVKAREETPLKRIGEPENVADLVVFLASDQSSFITGESICISGGRYFHA